MWHITHELTKEIRKELHSLSSICRNYRRVTEIEEFNTI